MTSVFGHLPDGRPVQRITISSGALTASLLDHGARLQDLRLAGHAAPLVLGSPRLADYLGPMDSFGATVGRYANRIAGGRFTLDGQTFQLDRNERDRTCLHGGSGGLHRQLWQLEDHGPAHATFALLLPDGHMGFPGALAATVTYRCDGTTLRVTMEATPTAPCPLSMANHAYFTLTDTGDIAAQELQVAATHYLPTDADKIPTGEIAAVTGTRFDFTRPTPIGPEPLDHCFCLDGDGPAARLSTPGLALEVDTDAPGLQVYNAAHLPTPGLTGLEGRLYTARAGLALETQEWPDAPNRPAFPDPVIRPGEVYRNATAYRFVQG